MKRSFLFPILTAFLLVVAACSSDSDSAEEEVLTIRYWQAPSLPFPYLSTGEKDVDAGAVTLEPLANLDTEGRLVPKLAQEIPTVENGGVSEDLRTITWKLKEDLKWSDGSDLTSADVVFTWRYCIAEDSGCVGSEGYDPVATVEAVDDLTVTVTFDEPTPYPYTIFVGAGSPILSATQFADCLGEAARSCVEQNTMPLGSGPYRIVDFIQTEGRGIYERNPHWRGDTPFFDRIVLVGGGSAEAAARAVLETGEADYAWNVQVEPELLEGLVEEHGLGTVGAAFGSLVERIVINQTNADPALGDDRSEYLDGNNPHPFLTFTPIPQAMSLAIDRSAIQELYGFSAELSCNLIAAPANYASTANDACLMQDIAAANKLLDDNGVLDTDGDTIREYNGIPLRITYQTTVNNIREATQLLIKDWWKQIGIETALVHHEASVFFGGDPTVDLDTYARFQADVQMYASSTAVDPVGSLSSSLCENIQSRENLWSSQNNARACNAEFDRLYEQLSTLPLGTEREELVKRLNDILVQNYYEIPLVNRGLAGAVANDIEGIEINPGWDTEMWNIAEWRRTG